MTNSEPMVFSTTNSKSWSIALWLIQILLAIAYFMSGSMNTFMSPEQLVGMGMSHATILPYFMLRFLGIAELLGSIGLLLPAAFRIMPILTVYAAIGFVVLQILAMIYHVMHGEFFILPINLVLLALALFISWGRTKKAVIRPR